MVSGFAARLHGEYLTLPRQITPNLQASARMNDSVYTLHVETEPQVVPSAPAANEGPEPNPARVWTTTVLFWSYMLVSNPVLWLGALGVFAGSVPFDRRRKLLHKYTSAWAFHYVKLMPMWKTAFTGREQIKDDQTYVLVANHQSLGDILVLFGLFKHFKWVSKAEIFKVPFVGWNMRMNDYVPLVRGDAASIEKMLDECRRHLRSGSSVMLFPEGTRSTDGQIKPFKRGAFALAKELGLPIVPIVVDGTHDALPKHGLVFRQADVLSMRIRVLEPIAADAADSVQALSDLVREKMVRELSDMRAHPA
jgi:1-acyl-sn-glycerol-3-phosphate acyltransferase